MKPKFVRVISPITLAVVLILDAATLYYSAFSIYKLIALYTKDIKLIMFAVCSVLALALGIAITVQTIKNGVLFHEDKVEFKDLDGENTFNYADIESVETKKDTKASLTKNFNDRQSSIVLNMKDGRIVTLTIGLTTVKTMEKVANLITEKLDKAE